MKSTNPRAKPELPPSAHRRLFESRRTVTFILVGVFLLSLLGVEWGTGVIKPGGFLAMTETIGALFRPELSSETLLKAATAAWQTVAYAVAGITIALLIGVPLGVLASGTTVRTRTASALQTGLVRSILAFFRSIHELVWALLFVAAIGLSPMSAILALGIPYGGILGRIYSELLQDVPQAPLDALRSSGASEWQVFTHGRLPMALPDMLSYTFYRFECGIRSAAVLGWIGLGGLGFQVQIALEDLAYERAWTFLWVLVVLVVCVDVWSGQVRRKLVS